MKIKNMLLVHGFGQNPGGIWYRLIKDMAVQHNIVPIIPQLPSPHHPRLKPWLEMLTPLANQLPAATILIGHSLGADTILHFLDAYNGEQKFPLLILVAPPVFEVGYKKQAEFFTEPFHYGSLKNKVERIVVIVTATDPVLKPDPVEHGLILVKEADAKLIVVQKGNHFVQNDDYGELMKAIVTEVDAVIDME